MYMSLLPPTHSGGKIKRGHYQRQRQASVGGGVGGGGGQVSETPNRKQPADAPFLLFTISFFRQGSISSFSSFFLVFFTHLACICICKNVTTFACRQVMYVCMS